MQVQFVMVNGRFEWARDWKISTKKLIKTKNTNAAHWATWAITIFNCNWMWLQFGIFSISRVLMHSISQSKTNSQTHFLENNLIKAEHKFVFGLEASFENTLPSSLLVTCCTRNLMLEGSLSCVFTSTINQTATNRKKWGKITTQNRFSSHLNVSCALNCGDAWHSFFFIQFDSIDMGHLQGYTQQHTLSPEPNQIKSFSACRTAHEIHRDVYTNNLTHMYTLNAKPITCIIHYLSGC